MVLALPYGEERQSKLTVTVTNPWHILDMTTVMGFINTPYALRRRNTRYKNPQLAAQHYFVASFGSIFRVFHLGWSTCRATETFVAGWRNAARWLVDLLGVDPRQVASLMKNEQQSQNFLLKVDSRFTFCNNFLQPIKKYLLRDKLITQGEKRETLTQNLQRNNVAQQVEGFCISCFAAFNKTCSGRGI